MPGGLDWFFSTSTGYGNTIIQYSSIEPSPSYTHYYHVDVPHDESDTSEGTLPWAVEDSFDMFVQDLQANNWSDAAQLAGKIAHYIGDGSNPLHATWNYNPPPPPGPGGGHGLYEGAVNGHLNEIDMSMLSSPRVIANVFDSTVHLLVESYCHTSVLIPYLSQSPPVSWNSDIKNLTEERLRASAQFLANIWYTAMIQAGLTILHDPIYIEGNQNFIPANGVVAGLGTVGDPYIIEGWDIIAESAHGINIKDTTAYFVIRNCSLLGNRGQIGIFLNDVKNGQIDHVTTLNNGCGISLRSSDYNNIVNSIFEEDNLNIELVNSSNNVINNCTFSVYGAGIGIYYSSLNTIESSTFEGAGFHGIDFVGASNNCVMNNVFQNLDRGISMDSSNNNHIYHNNFLYNTNQAYDDGSNYWDDGYPSGGNHWSGYGVDQNQGPNQDQPGSDGIGDTPYDIPGKTPPNQDHYPLMCKTQNFTPIGPNVEVTPTLGVSVTFTSVTSSGITTVTTSTSGPSGPTGYTIVGTAGLPTYYEITTTAAYSGTVTICISYDETQVTGDEANLKLQKWDGVTWQDITTSVDTVNNKIYGATTTLSIFIVAGPTPPAPVGGIAFPAGKLALLAPWIILAALIAIVAASVTVYWRRR